MNEFGTEARVSVPESEIARNTWLSSLSVQARAQQANQGFKHVNERSLINENLTEEGSVRRADKLPFQPQSIDGLVLSCLSMAQMPELNNHTGTQ